MIFDLPTSLQLYIIKNIEDNSQYKFQGVFRVDAANFIKEHNNILLDLEYIPSEKQQKALDSIYKKYRITYTGHSKKECHAFINKYAYWLEDNLR